jgi:flagellar operon protein
MGYRIINGVSYPVGNFPINNEGTGKIQKTSDNKLSKSFDEILSEKVNKSEGFKISNHAAERMENVKFDPKDMDKINEAINKARDKGSKNSLIVYKDVAMVTSIENRTVITAVEGSRAKDNIFTNIDSVILL